MIGVQATNVAVELGGSRETTRSTREEAQAGSALEFRSSESQNASMTQRLLRFLRGQAPVVALVALLTAGCHRATSGATDPLLQRGYLWQREWTPAVVAAITDAENKMDGVVILGAEIHWTGKTPQIIRANIPWEALKDTRKPYSIALRIAPFPGPFAADDVPARAIAETAKSLLTEAADHGMKLAEFQLDFDCAQKKLAGYRVWVGAVHQAIHPLRLVITALPAWLDEPGFLPLVREADGYVLQVHSVPTKAESGYAALCDPALARKWVAKAAKLGIPYSVALPTYRCLAGYAPSGKLLGIVMDSVQPAWPPDTRVLEFATNADEVAGLVKDWLAARPSGLRELIWYRIPVATDNYNWRWPTLSAVMAGRKPVHKLEVIRQGDNPVDLSISNTGEAEEKLECEVSVAWNGAILVASDSLAGWTLQVKKDLAVFKPEPGRGLRLPPGGKRGIGWLRYDQITPLRLQIAPALGEIPR